MFNSRNAVHRLDKLLPTVTLCDQHFLTFGSQAVITTSSLARLLNPTPLNPTTLFESIKQRVKRRDIETQPSLGPLLDQIPDVISMPGLILNERQNQQLRTPLLQLPVQHLRKLIWHSDILLRCI